MEPTQAKLLETAVELFADCGYAGVSMRQIARDTGVTQAAIYHHFANKDELYIASLEHVYAGQQDSIVNLLSSASDPAQRLALLVEALLHTFDEQAQFRRIYFRELLEGDQQRLELLSARVFPELGNVLDQLMEEVAPHMDKHLMVLSLAGLVFHHLEARKLSPLSDGGRAEHQDIEVLAKHITQLLLNGVTQQ